MTITLDRLKECRAALARAIKQDGPVYLPLFKRFDDEIKKREEDADLLTKALSYA